MAFGDPEGGSIHGVVDAIAAPVQETHIPIEPLVHPEVLAVDSKSNGEDRKGTLADENKTIESLRNEYAMAVANLTARYPELASKLPAGVDTMDPNSLIAARDQTQGLINAKEGEQLQAALMAPVAEIALAEAGLAAKSGSHVDPSNKQQSQADGISFKFGDQADRVAKFGFNPEFEAALAKLEKPVVTNLAYQKASESASVKVAASVPDVSKTPAHVDLTGEKALMREHGGSHGRAGVSMA